MPKKPQLLLEAFIGFINDFVKENAGHHGKDFAAFLGTIFIFLIAANLAPMLTPIGGFGFEPAFVIKPLTRDINVTAAFAITVIVTVFFSASSTRAPRAGSRASCSPSPIMLPFNLHGIRDQAAVPLPPAFRQHPRAPTSSCSSSRRSRPSSSRPSRGSTSIFLTASSKRSSSRSSRRSISPRQSNRRNHGRSICAFIGAGIAVLTGLGAGFGIPLATGKTSEAIARQPEASGKIQGAFLLGIALAEATAIYGLVVALLLIFNK